LRTPSTLDAIEDEYTAFYERFTEVLDSSEVRGQCLHLRTDASTIDICLVMAPIEYYFTKGSAFAFLRTDASTIDDGALPLFLNHRSHLFSILSFF
jgi:hypothetical protein